MELSVTISVVLYSENQFYVLIIYLGKNIPKPNLKVVESEIWAITELIDNQLALSAQATPHTFFSHPLRTVVEPIEACARRSPALAPIWLLTASCFRWCTT